MNNYIELHDFHSGEPIWIYKGLIGRFSSGDIQASGTKVWLKGVGELYVLEAPCEILERIDEVSKNGS